MATAPLPYLWAVTVNASDKPKLAFVDLLAQARPAESTVRLCLRGDLVAEFEEMERQLAAVQAKPANSLAGSGAQGIAEQIEALRSQMDDFSATFRLRALTRRAYQKLTAAHPARRGPDGAILPEDAEGLNSETWGFALIRACLIDPEISDEQYVRLVDEVLSDRQYEQLYIAALRLCRGDVDIPFSVAASQLTGILGGESKPLNGSESLSGASTAGNPATPSTTDPTVG